MKFELRLQQLRKERRLTQDQLAKELLVTRTAISKWETGAGYPNIDSLLRISKFFDISINELLSSEEAVIMAKDDSNKNIISNALLINIILDLISFLIMFLPFFANKVGDNFIFCNLMDFICEKWIKVSFYIIFITFGVISLLEIVYLIMNKYYKANIVLICSVAYDLITLLLFIMSREPYVGMFLLLFVIIKLFFIYKKFKICKM